MHPRFRKIKKTTTPVQFEILVNFLQEHRDMVTGFANSTVSMSRRRQLWIRLTDKLNRHGPPVRSYIEWKSIWSDYKYNLKRKLAADMKLAKRKNDTKRLLFNQTEQAAIDLMGIRDTVLNNPKYADKLNEGAVNATAPSDIPSTIEVKLNDSKEDLLVNCDIIPKEHQTPSMEECFESFPVEQEMIEGPEFNMDSWGMMKDTVLSMQRTQQAILKELRESNRYKRSSLELKERLLQLEQDKFQEQKMQNYEENKRAYVKTELKRKELELYELKLKGLCKECPIKRELE